MKDEHTKIIAFKRRINAFDAATFMNHKILEILFHDRFTYCFIGTVRVSYSVQCLSQFVPHLLARHLDMTVLYLYKYINIFFWDTIKLVTNYRHHY